MAKTVENAMQINVLKISKAAQKARSSMLMLEWVFGSSAVSGLAVLTDDTLIVIVGGKTYQASISRREFRKDRYLTHTHCLACAKKCFTLFIEGDGLKCRRCAGLIYECQRGHAPERAMIKAQKILARLGGASWHAAQSRPSGMWRKTYLRHLRHLAAARQAAFGCLTVRSIQ